MKLAECQQATTTNLSEHSRHGIKYIIKGQPSEGLDSYGIDYGGVFPEDDL